ncbi:unnamed protein product [Brassica oleracea var. botrytis]
MTQDEEEQQVEADTEVDDGDTERQSGTKVFDSGKGSETLKKDEDEEVNEDASKEPEKVKEKKQGKRNKGQMEEVEEVNEDASNVCGKVKKKRMQVKKNISGR